jgi:excisionase family DNA binding protein
VAVSCIRSPNLFTPEFLAEIAGAVAQQVISQLSAQGGVPQKRLFTIAEAAQYLGRTAKAVEHLIARGTIQVTKLDGKRQIDRSALDKIIDDHTYFEC